MMSTSVIGLDNGLCGAFVVLRVGSYGPELCEPAIRWTYTRRAQWERNRPLLRDRIRYSIRRWHPLVLACEEPKSIMGFKHVGISQARFAEWARQIAEDEGIEYLEVPGQSGEQPGRAFAILRQSLSEFSTREEMADMSGPAGEHARDAMAVGISALSRLPKVGALSRESR